MGLTNDHPNEQLTSAYYIMNKFRMFSNVFECFRMFSNVFECFPGLGGLLDMAHTAHGLSGFPSPNKPAIG